MAKKRSLGIPSALLIAINALVLQGFPTTRTRTSSAALAAIAFPCSVKIPPLIFNKSERSIPALRGTEPTSNAQLAPLNPSAKSLVATTSFNNGKAQSSNSMITP